MNFFRKKPYKFPEIEDAITYVIERIKIDQMVKKDRNPEFVIRHAFLEMKSQDSPLIEKITRQLEEMDLEPRNKDITPIAKTILWYLEESVNTNFPPTPIQIKEHYNSLIGQSGGYRKKSKRRNNKSYRKRKTYRRNKNKSYRKKK
jgi:hypothetical protein